MMNDATLRQMAAAKTTVNNENHMFRASSALQAVRAAQAEWGRPTRLPMAPAPNATQFQVLLCLPTAPALPTEGSGDFGTSPFYGQLSDKPQLAFINSSGVPDVKHNSQPGC